MTQKNSSPGRAKKKFYWLIFHYKVEKTIKNTATKVVDEKLIEELYLENLFISVTKINFMRFSLRLELVDFDMRYDNVKILKHYKVLQVDYE